jgi:hypothetical protein
MFTTRVKDEIAEECREAWLDMVLYDQYQAHVGKTEFMAWANRQGPASH